MKIKILLLVVSIGLASCHNKLYRTYPECAGYYDFIKKSWHKKDNGFFWIEEVRDTTEPVWVHLVKGPMFQRQWDKYANECLCQLSEREVKFLLGEPTVTHQRYNAVKKVTTEIYGYLVADGICEEIIPLPNNPTICSFMGFTFWKGKQDRRYTDKPRLSLHYDYD
jgi:hypothetical protein